MFFSIEVIENFVFLDLSALKELTDLLGKAQFSFQMPTSTRIHLISSPRNISTALMYSFSQRKDTTVVDEPFYAYYLNHTGIKHPGTQEILNSQQHDVFQVIQDVILGPYNTKVLFLKNMAHHIIDFEPQFLLKLKNIFLIRDPERLITSFSKVIEAPTMKDIGVQRTIRTISIYHHS